MSRTKNLSLGVIVLVWSTCVFADTTPVVLRNAASVVVSSGQTVDLLSTVTMRPATRISTVIFAGELGNPVLVTEEAELGWKHTSLSLVSGKHKIELRFFMGFVADGMPGPAEMRLGDKVYRWISLPTGEATPQKRAMQRAVSGLPEDVRRDVITFSTLCFAAGELVLPPSGFILPELFAETIPRAAALSITRLSPEEITGRFPNQAGEFLSSSMPVKRPESGTSAATR